MSDNVESIKFIIDFDASPKPIRSEIYRLTGGCKSYVVEHRKGGKIEFEPSQIQLYKVPGRNVTLIGDLYFEILRENNSLNRNNHILNANVLDYLLDHKDVIPESWSKNLSIYFWGTIYYVGVDGFLVRYLEYIDGEWRGFEDKFLEANFIGRIAILKR